LEGEKKIKELYGVFFLNFPLEHKLRTDGIIVDRDTGEQIIDKLRFIFIELPFFTKKEEEYGTNQELWLYTLKNMKTLKEIPFKERKPIFKKLEEIADLASLSKEERRLYDADIRAYRDRLTELGTARRDGEKRGIIKGRIEGEKIGERRGEKNKQLSIARNLKEKGLPVALIVETTGLSAEEVENL
jgi:predicted transposase/invertase (TIGR01784 family)